MKKEEIIVLAQLLSAMKDAIEKLEEARHRKQADKMASAKKEILSFQKKIGELL